MSKRRPKIRYSRWFITVNTNKQFVTRDESCREAMQQLEKATEGVLDHIENFVQLSDPNDRVSAQHFKSITLHYTSEIGEEKGQPHVHMLLAFSHWLHGTGMRLNYEAMKSAICQALGLDTIYFYARPCNMSQHAIEDYINKMKPQSLKNTAVEK